jgi:hypothetical protein
MDFFKKIFPPKSPSPTNAEEYYERGKSKAKDFLTDYLGALQDLEMAIKLDPQFAIAYYERGLIAMMVLKD